MNETSSSSPRPSQRRSLPPRAPSKKKSSRSLRKPKPRKKKTKIARVKSTLRHRRSAFQTWYEKELLSLAIKHLDFPSESVGGVLYHVPLPPVQHTRDSLIQVLDEAVESLHGTSGSVSSSRSGFSTRAQGTRSATPDLLGVDNAYDVADYDSWIRDYQVLSPQQPSFTQTISVVIEASPLPSPTMPWQNQSLLIDIEVTPPMSPRSIATTAPSIPHSRPLSVDEMFFGELADFNATVSIPSPPRSPSPQTSTSITVTTGLHPSPLCIRPAQSVITRKPVPPPRSPYVQMELSHKPTGKRTLSRRQGGHDLRNSANISVTITAPTPTATPMPDVSLNNRVEPLRSPKTLPAIPTHQTPSPGPRVPAVRKIRDSTGAPYVPYTPPAKRNKPYIPYTPTIKRNAAIASPILPVIPEIGSSSLLEEVNAELDNFLESMPPGSTTSSGASTPTLASPVSAGYATAVDDLIDLPSPLPRHEGLPPLPYIPYSQPLRRNETVATISELTRVFNESGGSSFRERMRNATKNALSDITISPPGELEEDANFDTPNQRPRRSKLAPSPDFEWQRWIDTDYEDPAVAYSRRQRERRRREKGKGRATPDRQGSDASEVATLMDAE